MATRILGPTGSKRRKRFLLAPVLLVALAALFLIGGAQAVHNDGLFELGPSGTGPTFTAGTTANIVGDGLSPDTTGPDWGDLFTVTSGAPSGTNVIKKDADNNNKPDCEQAPGKECAFIADPSSAGGALDPTTFSGFGTSNKNNDPISGPNTLTGSDCQVRGLTSQQCTEWGWDAGNVPAKDDLTNVYAYQVVAPADSGNIHKGDVIVYGGLERESPSGDSYVDLEFFQNPVDVCRDAALNPAPTCFTGVRKTGDVIVSMNFLKGGALGDIEIRKFNEATNSYGDPIGSASGQGCFNTSGNNGDDICAFNNAVPIDGGPWANYDNHGNVITQLPTNAFTEMGVDLTNVLGESPCLSTFMGKTRSSASFTSELKDFAGPVPFSRCKPSTTLSKSVVGAPTTGSKTVHPGDSVTYNYTETNDGQDDLSQPNATGSPTSTTDNGGWVEDDKCSPVLHVLGSASDTLTSDTTHNIGDLDNNNVLNVGEAWKFACTYTVASNASGTITNTAKAHGLDPLIKFNGNSIDVTYCTTGPNIDGSGNNGAGQFCDLEERAQASIIVINPATTLTKSVAVLYSYTEANTSANAPLTQPNTTGSPTSTTDNGGWVTDDKCDSISPNLHVIHVLGSTSDNLASDATHNIGDLDNNNVLDPNETWKFVCSALQSVATSVTNTANGHGKDATGADISYANGYLGERDKVKVTVEHLDPALP